MWLTCSMSCDALSALLAAPCCTCKPDRLRVGLDVELVFDIAPSSSSLAISVVVGLSSPGTSNALPFLPLLLNRDVLIGSSLSSSSSSSSQGGRGNLMTPCNLLRQQPMELRVIPPPAKPLHLGRARHLVSFHGHSVSSQASQSSSYRC